MTCIENIFGEVASYCLINLLLNREMQKQVLVNIKKVKIQRGEKAREDIQFGEESDQRIWRRGREEDQTSDGSSRFYKLPGRCPRRTSHTKT